MTQLIELGSSGIYQICCIPTGKIYIGSTVHLAKRWGEHRRSLRRGKHINCYLQSAWNKYGETNFVFSVLEHVHVADLLKVEQEWLDATSCTDKEIGFNIAPSAESPGGSSIRIWDGFIDPQGNFICIVGLEDFCLRNNLDYRSMHKLAVGKSKLKSYKGWIHRNSIRQRSYVKTYEGFIDPDGNILDPITNLADFCRKHGLDQTHMLAVAKGRICSHRKWTHTQGRVRLEQKTHAGFVNPAGEHVIITNLAAYCREHGLHPVKMHNLKSGKIRRYKGWTWRNDYGNTELVGRDLQTHESACKREQPIFIEARS